MSEPHRMIAGLMIHDEEPTEVRMKELFTWVVWQFPRPYHSGYCGAVRPQTETKQWLPAVIQAGQKTVQIHGYVKKTFRTPETAADYLHKAGRAASKK